MLRAGLGLLLGLLSAWMFLAAPARAACDGPAPSFRHGARTAQTLVVGEVTAAVPAADAGGFAREFTLRVDHVLRGAAPPVMELRDLVMQPCAGLLLVHRDDIVALAFGAREFDTDVNAVAFVRGVPSRGDIEQLTLADVFAVAGVPVPVEVSPSLAPPWGLVLAAGLVAGTAIVAFRSGRSRMH